MAPVLGPAQRRELLGSMLRELAQQQDEELQACAARLLAALVEALGTLDPGWCALCALPLALELAQYADYGVRLVRFLAERERISSGGSPRGDGVGGVGSALGLLQSVDATSAFRLRPRGGRASTPCTAHSRLGQLRRQAARLSTPRHATQCVLCAAQESVHSIVRLLGCAEASAGDREAVLGALRALCEDAVWSVRQEVAGELAVAAAALPPEQAGAVVLPLHQRWARMMPRGLST